LTSGITFLAGLASANLFARQATDPCESIAACASINNAVNACTDDACFCPTALAVAAACASCYATVNATLSADLSSAIVQCQTEGYSAGEAVPTTATTPAVGANATAAGGANSLAVQTSDAGATGTTGSDDPGATGNSSPDSGDSGDATGGSGNTASATKSASNSKSSAAASHDVFGFSFGVLLVVLVASVLTLFG
jgi:cobalamin biosynthesis Mg chelatase CobN